MTLYTNREGKYQAGLFAAWDLVAHLTDGPARRFMDEHRKRLQNHIKGRDQSILAHGFTPIRNADWQALAAWIEGPVIEMLLAETAPLGITLPPPLPVVIEGIGDSISPPAETSDS